MGVVVPSLYTGSNVIFEVEINGLSKIFTNDGGDGNPKIPISFKFTETSDVGTGGVVMVFNDRTGGEVDKYIWTLGQGQNTLSNIGRFRFGYSYPELMSEWIGFLLQNYTVANGKNNFVLTLTGTGTPQTGFMGNNAIEGTLEECIEKYAEIHGNINVIFNPPFDKTEIVELDNQGRTSEYKERRFTQPADQTDAAFVDYLIRNFAAAPGTKKGYQIYRYSRDGIEYMECFIPDAAKVMGKYLVQDSDTPVISWSPEVSLTMGAGLLKDESYANATNTITGEELKVCVNPEYQAKIGTTPVLNTGVPASNLQGFPFPGELPEGTKFYNSETMPGSIQNRGLRVVRGGTFGACDWLRVINQHAQSALAAQKASLVIMGDPTVRPGSLVEVIYDYPYDYFGGQNLGRHYTSGKYLVREVEHVINVGVFRTTLSLTRNDRVET
jgi:hypothetical protein